MKQKLFITTIALILLFSTVVSAATIEDVPQNHWAYQSVTKLVDEGLLELYEDDTFRGNDTISRYQLAEIVARLLENIEGGSVSASAQDMELLRKLSVEFQEELVDLAVQGDAFAKQIKSIEQKNIIQDEFMTEIKDVDISLLKDQINSLSEKIRNVESDVSQIIDSIIRIKQIEERLTIIEEASTKQGSLIEENQKQIEELRELNLKTTDETIEDLQNRISINATRIRSLQSEVNTLKSELNSKNNQITDLEVKKEDDQNYLYGIAGVGLLLLLISN